MTGGVQDDVMFATVWAIYGLRFKEVSDMQPRNGKVFLGKYIKNKETYGSYED